MQTYCGLTHCTGSSRPEMVFRFACFQNLATIIRFSYLLHSYLHYQAFKNEHATKSDQFAQPTGKPKILLRREIAFVISGQFSRGKEIREQEHYCETLAMMILTGERLGQSSSRKPWSSPKFKAFKQWRFHVNSVTRAHHALLLTECNHSRLMSLKFPFVLILTGTIIALWRWLRNSAWEVLMRTCALLRKPRHKAMITPVSPLRTRLVHVSPIYWIIFCSFEIILERKLSIGLEFKVNVLCKSIASRNIQSDMNYI